MPLILVGLGTGRVDDLTVKALRTLESVELVSSPIPQHPIFTELNLRHLPAPADVEFIMVAARQTQIAYATLGDPLWGDVLGAQLLATAQAAQIPVEIVRGVIPSLPEMPTQGVQILPAHTFNGMHFPPINPDFPTLISNVEDVALLQKILLNQYPAEFEVLLLHGGTNTQKITVGALDQIVLQGFGNALYIPAPQKYTSFEAFQEIIAHLRAPEGCPWDRKQTHESLRPYLIEEAYEVLDAIDQGDWQELAGELGDLLLQVMLHTQIATEHNEFFMRDVLHKVNTKMIRRHPHVWGDVNVNGDDKQVLVNWDEIKRAEQADQPKKRESLLDGLPKGLPALAIAYKYNERAAKVGFDWKTVAGVEDKLREEMEEIIAETDPAKKAREIGDLIFVLVNWLRWLKIDDPESLLREINAKFYRRFRYIEEHAPQPLPEMTLEQMDALWNEAKQQGL